MGTNVHSRFVILKHDQLIAPFKCIICSSSRGLFIDFGLDLDDFGAIYFCTNCFSDCSRAVGFGAIEQQSQFEKQRKDLEAIITTLQAENKDLKDGLHSFSRLADRFGTPGDSMLEINGTSPEYPDGSTGAESGSTGSTDELGHSDILPDERNEPVDDIDALLDSL